jgi:protein SCO1
MQRKTLLFSLTALVLLVVVTGGLFFLRKPAFRNEVIDPPLPATEINMLDDQGNAFRLSDQRGKVVLLYFGFVNCPDECPLTMAHVKQALGSLGNKAQEVQVVMVSTDPVRDTPQAMNDFLGAFNPAFIGIPGKSDDLAKIYQDYGVVVLDGGETHSSYTYVIDRKGNIRLTFVPDSAPEDIAHDLSIVLAEK